MTQALCLNCGTIKFGAICSCPKCDVESTGNFELDILFSDHTFSLAILEAFSGVVEAIHQAEPEPEERLLIFMGYLSQHYPQILTTTFEPEMEERVQQRLSTLDLQSFDLEKIVELEKKRKRRSALLFCLLVIGLMVTLYLLNRS